MRWMSYFNTQHSISDFASIYHISRYNIISLAQNHQKPTLISSLWSCHLEKLNGSSNPLLKLPQEIKNQMYYLAFGGQVIHVTQKASGKQKRLHSHTGICSFCPTSKLGRTLDGTERRHVLEASLIEQTHTKVFFEKWVIEFWTFENMPSNPRRNSISCLLIKHIRFR